jgi:hypothetical protein
MCSYAVKPGVEANFILDTAYTLPRLEECFLGEITSFFSIFYNVSQVRANTSVVIFKQGFEGKFIACPCSFYYLNIPVTMLG